MNISILACLLIGAIKLASRGPEAEGFPNRVTCRLVGTLKGPTHPLNRP